ncbi:MAG: response regulator transcription factor, partial [Cyanobium sp.]
QVPDLLLLDLTLPDQGGLAVAETLAQVNPEARLIVLSASANSFVCDSALQPMLHAVVDKIDACEALTTEIGELLGERHDDRAPLTAREEEVLGLIGQGLSNGQIAERLTLSVHTVGTHRRNISGKLGLRGGGADPPCHPAGDAKLKRDWAPGHVAGTTGGNCYGFFLGAQRRATHEQRIQSERGRHRSRRRTTAGTGSRALHQPRAELAGVQSPCAGPGAERIHTAAGAGEIQRHLQQQP